MNILRSLSARHLRLNSKRTVITIIGIALSVAMVTAISGFIVSFQDMLYNDSVIREGLWHVQYSGLSAETAEAVAAEPVFAGSTATEGNEGTTLLLLFEKLDRGVFDRSEEVCFRYGIEKDQVRYHNNLLIAKGIVPGGYYESLYTFAAILLSLVAIASIMVISNAFSISASERSRQFGLLKSVGATTKQIRSIVLWEGALLGLCAIPLGLLGGLAAQWVALTAANQILGSMEAVKLQADFRIVLSPWVLVLAVIAAMVTVFLAAWLPARRASRLSAIDAIRQTTEVTVRPRDVRVPPVIGKVFGFEGLLAAKTMKRSRRRYRTTILSLVVSIVLFIGVSSFGQMLFKSASMVYEDHGSNVYVRITGGDEQQKDRLAGQIAAIDGSQSYPFRELSGLVAVSPEWLSETGLEMLGAGEKNIYLYSLSDQAYADLCRKLHLQEGELADPEHPGGILINATGTYIRQGRRHNFTPYKSLTGQSLSFRLGEDKHSLLVAGETKEIPVEVRVLFSANAVNLIVPVSVYDAWRPSDTPSELQITAMAIDAEAFAAQANDILSAELGESGFYVGNYEALAENSRNIWTLIMLFVYGFIAMLTLISVTNVVTTISTGIALRKRELAMLQSMGMTSKGITKSLRYESLIYGLKSLLYGIPLGLVVSLAMYHALGASMSFEFIWPVQSIAISIVAVLLLTVVTMSFASRRQRGNDIVGTLQSEII